MKIVKVAEYLRYSSEMQRDSLSIEGQHEVNLRFCVSKSISGERWEIVETYKDEAQSASTTNRPDFQRMMANLRGLVAPINTFFTDVMVMAEDANLRKSRLALLGRIVSQMRGIADLSKLEGF